LQPQDGHWYGTYDEERKICVADHVDTAGDFQPFRSQADERGARA
jgi:hypothetical protein